MNDRGLVLMLAPMIVCCFMVSNSSGVSRAGFSRIASLMPTLPMSCRGLARWISSWNRSSIWADGRRGQGSDAALPGFLAAMAESLGDHWLTKVDHPEDGCRQQPFVIIHLLASSANAS